MTVRGKHLYWGSDLGSSGGWIGRANVDGSRVKPGFVKGGNGVCGVAASGSHLYWANQDSGAPGTPSIGRSKLGGSHVDQSFIGSGKAQFPCGVAFHKGLLYWSNDGDNTAGASTLERAHADGTHVQRALVADPDIDGPCGVAVDAKHLYWTNQTLGTIGRARLDGSHAKRDFITTTGTPCGLAVYRSHIYWGTFGPAIGRADTDGAHVRDAFINVEPTGSVCGVAIGG